MGASRALWRRDEGMTLIEILFASVVLFFAITAVLGLIAASTRINVQSTEQTVLVNRVQSYIEGVRRLSWDEIGVNGGAVPGSLPVNSHFVESGYEVTITPTITWVNDPQIEGDLNYKKLTVVAIASPTGGSGTPQSYTVETYIRESDSNRPEDAAPPEMEFASGSPAIMGVVSGTSVMVYGHAWSPMENGILQKMTFYIEGRALRDSSTPAGVAEWPLEQADVTRSFAWDTTKLDEDGRPFSHDGLRQLKIQCWDNVGQTTYRVRQVIIDNYDPLAPGSLTAQPQTDVLARLSWPMSLDGPVINGVSPDPAYGYQMQIRTQGSAGWSAPTAQFLGNVSGYQQTTTPFSRYQAAVVAVSPGGRLSPATAAPKPYISRSRLSATWKNTYSGNNTSRVCATVVNLSLSVPTFPYSSVITTLYRSTSPDMSGASVVAAGSGFTTVNSYATAVGKTGVPTKYYYQTTTRINPALPDPAAPTEYVKSNIIGPVGDATTGTLATAGW